MKTDRELLTRAAELLTYAECLCRAGEYPNLTRMLKDWAVEYAKWKEASQ